MLKILLCIIIISTLLLFGFVIYYYLSKMSKNGDTEIILDVALCKILKIKLRSKHSVKFKKKQ